jgi:hypothetical protein
MDLFGSEALYHTTYFPGRKPTLQQFKRSRAVRILFRIAMALLVFAAMAWLLYRSVQH